MVITTTSSVQSNICDGDAFTLPGGRKVTTGGTYTDTLLNFLRCDSIITTQFKRTRQKQISNVIAQYKLTGKKPSKSRKLSSAKKKLKTSHKQGFVQWLSF